MVIVLLSIKIQYQNLLRIHKHLLKFITDIGEIDFLQQFTEMLLFILLITYTFDHLFFIFLQDLSNGLIVDIHERLEL